MGCAVSLPWERVTGTRPGSGLKAGEVQEQRKGRHRTAPVKKQQKGQKESTGPLVGAGRGGPGRDLGTPAGIQAG